MHEKKYQLTCYFKGAEADLKHVYFNKFQLTYSVCFVDEITHFVWKIQSYCELQK